MNPQSKHPAKALRSSAFAVGIAAMAAGFILPASAAPVPANLGSGLGPLLKSYQKQPGAFADLLASKKDVASDAQGRVRVNIHADGTAALADVAARARQAGANVTKVYPGYRKGIVTAYVPMKAVAALAQAPGVMSVVLSHNPQLNVGRTTSQGTVVMNTDDLNDGGVTGAGITVGVMSDSYNTNRTAKYDAADDVESGDLPDLTNTTNANSPGVKFLIEGPRGSTDEGRGMAQIVHDVAPGADLCFATAYNAETDFADNIRALRTDAACNADVIVDDIIYYSEPMFSDGLIAQAADDVVTSTVLAGKPVAYFSSAGNRGRAYTSHVRIIPDVEARGVIDAADQTVDLSTIPDSIDTRGGFQDFDPGFDNVDISQEITCQSSACTIDFQWDDPFDIPQGVTSDWNFLVFDTSGKFVADLSMIDNNFSTQQPIEISSTALAADTRYRIVLARTGRSNYNAKYVKYVSFGGSLLMQYNSDPGSYASTFGHNSAAHTNGVAAYIYDDVPVDTPPYDTYSPSLETYSSPGPVKILFDAAGNRLSEVEIRDKPDMAAPDGVNTTFFPSGALSSTDYEGDGYPNFFGTSAAAPHAAGVAALLLDKAGGSQSLSAAEIRSALQSTAPARDTDALYADAKSGKLTVSATGGSATDPNFFKIAFAGIGTVPKLVALTIDATETGLQFDPDPTSGYPLTVGKSTGPVLTSAPPTAPTSVLDLSFSGFSAGNSLSFGIDRDVALLAGYGNSADLLAGSLITATFSDGSRQLIKESTVANQYGTGYFYDDGYGLIDAAAAADTVGTPAP